MAALNSRKSVDWIVTTDTLPTDSQLVSVMTAHGLVRQVRFRANSVPCWEEPGCLWAFDLFPYWRPETMPRETPPKRGLDSPAGLSAPELGQHRRDFRPGNPQFNALELVQIGAVADLFE